MAGVDVQDDRLECEVVGFGLEDETWSIDYYRILGDPDAAPVWVDLDSILTRRWRHAHGYHLSIMAACVDSGGHHTQRVYGYCRARAARRIHAIKGRAGAYPIWPRLERRRRARDRTRGRGKVVLIGVDTAKDRIHAALQRREPGPGYMHTPKRYPPEWYEGLTAEQIGIKYVRGRPHRVWTLPKGVPNEPLDCRVYAIAAYESCVAGGLNLEKLAERRANSSYASRAEDPPAPRRRGGRKVIRRGAA
jgi:phage terminase large subunit GpA-like protein